MNSQVAITIVQLTPYYKIALGGLATMVRTLTQSLARNFAVSVIVTGEGRPGAVSQDGNVRSANYVLRVPFGGESRIKSFAGWAVYLVPTLWKLWRVYRHGRNAVVHLHFATPELHYFGLLRTIAGLKYVVTLHGSDVMRHNEQPWIARALIRYSLKRACGVVAVSNALAENAHMRFPFLQDRIAVVHNGVDCEVICATLMEQTEVNGPTLPRPYFLLVGGLQQVKGQDIAIEAWSLLKSRAPDLHLVIIGDGSLAETYRNMVGQLDLQSTVHFVGVLPTETVWRTMQSAAGLLISSRSEGLPYTALEAGVVKVPVVATRVGGVPELIENEKEGLLIPPENPEALADAVVRIIRDKELAAQTAAALHRRVLQNFSAQAMAQRYVEIYQRCNS